MKRLILALVLSISCSPSSAQEDCSCCFTCNTDWECERECEIDKGCDCEKVIAVLESQAEEADKVEGEQE